MKKLFVCLFLMLCLIFCVSCDLITDRNDARGENEYKLTVIDTFGYLAEPLEEYYTAGQEVKVHIIFLSGPKPSKISCNIPNEVEIATSPLTVARGSLDR